MKLTKSLKLYSILYSAYYNVIEALNRPPEYTSENCGYL